MLFQVHLPLSRGRQRSSLLSLDGYYVLTVPFLLAPADECSSNALGTVGTMLKGYLRQSRFSTRSKVGKKK